MVCFSEDRIVGGLKYVMLVIGFFWCYGTLNSWQFLLKAKLGTDFSEVLDGELKFSRIVIKCLKSGRREVEIESREMESVGSEIGKRE